MNVQLMLGSNPQVAILREWRLLGGKASALGNPITNLRPHSDFQSYYRHFEGGSVCWASPENVFPITKIVVRYKDERQAMTIPQIHTFAESFMKMPKGKPKGPWRKLFESDPIGQDPGEEANWVGREGWQIFHEITKTLHQRYQTRFEESPPNERLDREGRFHEIDRGNYEAERISIISRTA